MSSQKLAGLFSWMQKRGWHWHWQNLLADQLADAMNAGTRHIIDEFLTFESSAAGREQRRSLLHHLHISDAMIAKHLPWWFYGRAWLTIPVWWQKYPGQAHTICIHPTWHIGRTSPAISVHIGDGDGGDDIDFHLAIPPVSLWLSLEGVLPRRWAPHNPLDLGVRLFDQAIWISLLCDMHECDNRASFRDPSSRKRQPVFHYVDWLLGKQQYTRREIGTVLTQLELPEGRYQIQLIFTEVAWQRARWPWPVVVRRVEAAPHVPLPIPGKGENSYDCDDDAIYSSTFSFYSMADALLTLASSVLDTRRRYGGDHWVPDGGWPSSEVRND